MGVGGLAERIPFPVSQRSRKAGVWCWGGGIRNIPPSRETWRDFSQEAKVFFPRSTKRECSHDASSVPLENLPHLVSVFSEFRLIGSGYTTNAFFICYLNVRREFFATSMQFCWFAVRHVQQYPRNAEDISFEGRSEGNAI